MRWQVPSAAPAPGIWARQISAPRPAVLGVLNSRSRVGQYRCLPLLQINPRLGQWRRHAPPIRKDCIGWGAARAPPRTAWRPSRCPGARQHSHDGALETHRLPLCSLYARPGAGCWGSTENRSHRTPPWVGGAHTQQIIRAVSVYSRMGPELWRNVYVLWRDPAYPRSRQEGDGRTPCGRGSSSWGEPDDGEGDAAWFGGFVLCFLLLGKSRLLEQGLAGHGRRSEFRPLPVSVDGLMELATSVHAHVVSGWSWLRVGLSSRWQRTCDSRRSFTGKNSPTSVLEHFSCPLSFLLLLSYSLWIWSGVLWDNRGIDR